MLLGQLVGISVASNLFYLAICLSMPRSQFEISNSSLLAPPVLWFSVLLSLITVGVSPLTSERTFLPNLLLMHALLFVPFISNPTSNFASKSSFSIRIRTLYSIITVLVLALRLRTILSALSYIPQEAKTLKMVVVVAWRVLHSHPAQSSIGWDVVWTTISFFVWKILGIRMQEQGSLGPKLVPLVTSTFVASVGVSAADDWRKEEVEELSKAE